MKGKVSVVIIFVTMLILIFGCKTSQNSENIKLGKIIESKDSFKNSHVFTYNFDVYSSETFMKIAKYSLHQKVVKEISETESVNIIWYFNIILDNILTKLDDKFYVQIDGVNSEFIIDKQQIASKSTTIPGSTRQQGNQTITSSNNTINYIESSFNFKFDDQLIESMIRAENVVIRFYSSGTAITFVYNQRMLKTIEALINS